MVNVKQPRVRFSDIISEEATGRQGVQELEGLDIWMSREQ
jgi:hypothetical protein